MEPLGALTFVLAAEPAIDEPSTQFLFLIVGGVFAMWAVVLAVIGLKRPKFPGKGQGGRMVVALSTLLMLGTMVVSALVS